MGGLLGVLYGAGGLALGGALTYGLGVTPGWVLPALGGGAGLALGLVLEGAAR